MMEKRFDPADMRAFEPTEKVALLATVTPEGLPHVSLITTLMAKSPTEMIWGQFTEGRSKKNVLQNPKTGWLIMTVDRHIWRGKARYTGNAKEGPEYEILNNKPLFRYNSYFGIHTVHFMDLVETGVRENLPLASIVPASLATSLLRRLEKRSSEERVLTPWAESLFKRLDALKFLAYVGEDGFPRIVPLLQCQAADSRRLVFSPFAYADELERVPPNEQVAIYGLTFQMESVLVRGAFSGFHRKRLLRSGSVDIEWVYNSMPPKPGRIHPPVPLEAVRDFR